MAKRLLQNPMVESVVPNQPIIPFIEGDGTGPDIWAAAQKVLDAAVEKAYGENANCFVRKVYAGEKILQEIRLMVTSGHTESNRTPSQIGIKGPLTTPVGGGIRSINVALRQELDLYTCLRPVRYFAGVPSPLKNPEHTNMVIFVKTPRIFMLVLNTTLVQRTVKNCLISYKMRWV